jgi:CRP-like cAMP-binding protein
MDDERVASIPLLAVLDKRARRQVLRTAREAHYAAGQAVVRQDDPATVLYLIVSGHAVVQQGDRTLGRLGPGEFFGELALIEAHGRTATVVAEDELDCLLISAWEFKASLEEHPQMAIPMLNAIITRLHGQEHHTT